MDNQKTIAKSVKLSGVGLHTANKVSITFKPAGVDEGINFIRIDLPGKPVIKADAEHLVSLLHGYRRTSIGKDNAEIHTIEHLMSALAGVGIDNLNIEIDNNEIPGMDGSARDFVKAIKEAGIVEQTKPKNYFLVRESAVIEDNGACIMVTPAPELRISYTLSYDHPLLKAQYLDIFPDRERFEQELGPARTFCLEDEAKNLQNKGLGLGANYENTLVMGKDGVVNNKLRFGDEFVRHKVLDLMGDLYLLGMPIKGHIIAVKSGHALNLKLLSKLKQQKDKQSLGGIKLNYNSEFGQEFGASTIMKILPHRPPFLFVDRVLSLEQGKRITAVKNVTINDYFFVGHFPGKPIMPGVIMIEAMAQAGGIMMLSGPENRGKLAYFLAANNVKFRKTVVPGDQLVLEVEVLKFKSKTGLVSGRALVDGKVAVEAELMFALVEE
ncbi:MAG: bifunctional UDP-3-O-[3-hydroxymyristoyl] N-acetylglucosamine deacetylase/3-hydroxyacyl-ACP dehydratase [Candidatus Omnitrophica bacterium]|nr:bifunctional UDP-3-O-[3-hydroxymyristoyl] N-acetylglucosamine deacetylase/3-hydroxyacyl-ACP dehydratase [Candidatus Omnitrophota bacterium]MDD5236423.1 bifunctional UDP-3-O-[3-hydroxymyristoyl] N-acetylglucosamine deacetylase/3-hydroxyacyl-ACP dehydratase [Candidatus Omnitrophota bacterium]MDD5610104.1 bifunctional UDP-3-O-[3-hydroxymyristoyl] N-acetylglucosamine deacetylase/3-hydroxyacyl-ACP dehydratase [Candidatus Omnitrophota bacterium]